MRTKSTIKNGAWGSASYVIIFILGLLARRAFVQNFDESILGYSGVISNIFSLISIAELGVGTVISYGLYKEVEKKDKDEIAKLMMIYKWMYRVIGVAVLLTGIVCFFFLPMIIVEPDTNWTYVYIVYAIELTNAVLIYFMSFRRLLFIACQQEYLCIRIETSLQVVAYLVRIFVAYYTNLYVVYLSAVMAANIIANAIINLMCNRMYSYAKYTKVTIADMKEHNVFHDVKAYGIQKLSIAIYGGIDNIIAMRMLGVSSVVALTNYSTVEAGVSGFFNKLLSGFQPGIGSLIYDKNNKNKDNVFNSLNLISFMIAAFVAVCYATLFQTFITQWMGEKFLLPFAYVICFSINQYIGWNHRMMGYFRSAIGKFEEDQKYMIASAVTNVVLSIVLVKAWGVAGLLAATCIGHMFQWIGRSKVVFENIIGTDKAKPYWMKQIGLGILAAIEVSICVFLGSFFRGGIIGIAIRAIICVIVPNLINLAIIWKMSDFEYGRGLLTGMASKLIKKVKHSK